MPRYARNDNGRGKNPQRTRPRQKTSGTGPPQDRTARSTGHVTSWVRPSKSPLKSEGVGGVEAVLRTFARTKVREAHGGAAKTFTRKMFVRGVTRADTRSAPTGCGFPQRLRLPRQRREQSPRLTMPPTPAMFSREQYHTVGNVKVNLV